MVDYTIANQIRPFQLPDIAGISNAMQAQSLNAMREQQLLGEEVERRNLRNVFADPNFNPADPTQARRILEAAPRSGHATYSALLRGYADQRAAEASARAGAAAGRQAELANAQIELHNFDLQRQALIGIANLPEADRPAAWTAWRAQTEARLPRTRGNIPREYSDAAYLDMISKANEVAARRTAQNAPPAPFTLSPGQTRYSGTGQPIASSDARDPARETKLRDIMTTFNVDRATAMGVADGIIRLDTDPVTGQSRVSNLITRQTEPLSVAPIAPEPAPLVTGPRQGLIPPAAPAPAAPAPVAPAPVAPAPAAATAPRQTLYELAQTPFTTGAFPAAAAAGQTILGQIGANIVDPAFTERRQAFSNAQGDLIRSLSLNPRYPVAEMQRIRQEINVEPSVLTDPQTLLARMRSVDSSLRNRLANEERAAADTSLPVAARRDAATAANDIRNFIATLGVPQGQPPAAAPATPPPRRGTLDRRTQTGTPQRLRFNPATGDLEPVQ